MTSAVCKRHLKKSLTYKLKVTLYLADKTEDLYLGHNISDNSERLYRRGREPEPRMWKFLRDLGQNIERLLLM